MYCSRRSRRRLVVEVAVRVGGVARGDADALLDLFLDDGVDVEGALAHGADRGLGVRVGHLEARVRILWDPATTLKF